MRNPLESEDAAFRYLLGLIAVMAVIVGLVLLGRAIF